MEIMGKEKGYNSNHGYFQVKDGPKRVKKNFSMVLERVFEMVWWRGKMGSHWKGFLKLKRLSPPKMLTTLLFEETFGAFLFLSFLAPSLRDLG
jgi:hypothetical protein